MPGSTSRRGFGNDIEKGIKQEQKARIFDLYLACFTQQEIAERLEKGLTYAVACSAAGIHYATFRRWINRGKDAGQGEYCDFCDTVRAAEMVGRRKMERRAFKESKPLEYLERRYPEDWGRKDRAEIGGDIRVTVEWATPANAK